MTPRDKFRFSLIAEHLAAWLLAGEWSRPLLLARTEEYLGGRARTAQRYLVADILADWTRDYSPSPQRLKGLILESRWFVRAATALARRPGTPAPVLDPPKFAPAPRFDGLDIPPIATLGDLSQWLGLSVRRMEWLADTRKRHGAERTPCVQNYEYAFLAKRSGGHRLVEAPKPQLKAAQRRILNHILAQVPVHDAVHGFVRGRSCLTSAQKHAGERVVLTLDIADFFSTTPIVRVHAAFRRLGYPHNVARVLTGLCTTMTPASTLGRGPAPLDWETCKRLGAPHLPQGAPTSPMLANLAAARLDARLAGLACAFSATYTRYADDLSFSGGAEFERQAHRLIPIAETILREEGWRANRAKTRLMSRSCPQVVTGIVVNDHLNVRRADYDALKAILFNCVKSGPASQNRDGVRDFRAHLNGRIGWVASLNPARAERLRLLFNQIEWA